MTKRTSLFLLVLGILVLMAALINLIGPGEGGKPSVGNVLDMKQWPPLRIGLLSAGALLGILGAYGLSKQPAKK
jgi:hypothetical protein